MNCGCEAPNLVYENSSAYCANCGQVLEESQLASEVTFGENSAGGAVVNGSYLSGDQSHIRSSNPRFRSGGAGESREQTLYRAKEAIERMGRANRVRPHVRDKAARWFSLALDSRTDTPRAADDTIEYKNFVLGRRAEYTTASCLYLACRMEREDSHMLIDFADALGINVFTLGRHYLKLVVALNVQNQVQVSDPAIFIARFAGLLHFGDETDNVGKTAVRIVNRFKKDWLVEGRRPAGVCGAALLLAARMHNFRRTLSEIVQVVKMADSTIRERLEEFRATPTSSLTVADFRDIWLEEEQQPPAFVRPALEAEKLRIKQEKQKARPAKRRKTMERAGSQSSESDADDADREDEGETSTAGNNGDSSSSTELPPELDALAEEATMQEISQYTSNPEFEKALTKADEENAASAERAKKGGRTIENGSSGEIVGQGENGGQIGQSGEDVGLQIKTSSSQAPRLSQLDEQVNDEQNGPTDGVSATTEQVEVGVPNGEQAAAAGPSRSSDNGDGGFTTLKPIIKGSIGNENEDRLSDLDEDELDQFILGPQEIAIKERVWMEFNHDYLTQAIQRRIKEERDIAAGIRPRASSRRRGDKKSPRDSSTASGRNASESTKAMLEKKKFSKKINYDVLQSFSAVSPSDSKKRKKNKKRQDGDDGSGRFGYWDNHGVSDQEMELAGEEDAMGTLPSTHPLARRRSKLEQKQKARRSREVGATSGEESGRFTDGGATTEADDDDDDDDEDDDAEAAELKSLIQSQRALPDEEWDGQEYE